VNFQGVKGEGLTTGDTYTFAYADNRNLVIISLDGTITETQVLAAGHLISQGPDQSAPDLLVHAVLHGTINSNGELTAFIDNFSAECR
jgi:phosphatidate phosphatase PAH1